MNEPALPKSQRHRPNSIGTATDASAPASSRQVARLRFLGVAYREPLTFAQAGSLIDRTNADPEFAARIEEWHVRKFELHPALYPPTGAAIVVPAKLTAGTEFKLPPRGETEPNATIFQKRRLELFSGCDFPVMDSLGRDQAATLIAFLESQAVARSLESIQADAAARQQEIVAQPVSVPEPSMRGPAAPHRAARGRGVGKWLFMGTLAALAVAAYLNLGTIKTWVSAFVAAGGVPGQSSADTFTQALALSQQRAVQKYPALGVAGSPFNAAFLGRYQQLTQQRSPILNQPDWPEKIADECAARKLAPVR